MNKIKKIGFFFLLLTTVLLSWDLIYGNIAIGITTAFALYFVIKEKKIKSFTTLMFVASTSIFFVYVIGVIYSTDMNYGTSFVGSMASLIVFPIIFIGFNLRKKQLNILILFFVSSYTFRSLYAIITIGIKLYSTKSGIRWYFQEISNNGGFQPAYMGLFSVTSMILLLYLFDTNISIWSLLSINKSTYNDHKKSKFIYLILFIFHLFFLVVLATRMALITLIIIAVIYTVAVFRKEKRKRIGILIGMSIFMGLSSLFVSQNNSLKFKLKQMKNINEFKYNKYDASGVSSRIAKWTAAINIGKENPLFGVGTGDLPAQMMKQFYQLDCLSCKIQKYNNPHNQYLDSFARNGIIGVISLLFLLSYSFITSIKHKNIFYTMFMVMFMVMILSECLLNREKGVELFAFINAFYLFGSNSS